MGPPQIGDLPVTRGFVTVAPEAVQLSALRKKTDGTLEVRVVEVEGHEANARVELGFPMASACETDFPWRQSGGRCLGGKSSPLRHEALEDSDIPDHSQPREVLDEDAPGPKRGIWQKKVWLFRS